MSYSNLFDMILSVAYKYSLSVFETVTTIGSSNLKLLHSIPDYIILVLSAGDVGKLISSFEEKN